jgi:hypothetical protein
MVYRIILVVLVVVVAGMVVAADTQGTLMVLPVLAAPAI